MSAARDIVDDFDPPPVLPERAAHAHHVEDARDSETVGRFALLSVAELHKLPKLIWAVHSVLPNSGVAAIYGPSGSGKSFIIIDLVAAMAEKTDWFGYRIPLACRVVMVVLEGEAGFRKRIKAWEIAHSRSYPDCIKFVFQPFRLNERSDVLALAAAIDSDGGTDVVVIDTLNRAAPGSDENSSRDIGLILDNCKELQSLFGGLVIAVHHTGKDAGKGMRGHSSLHAALDAAVEVTRTPEQRSWTLAKSKDDADGKEHPFRLDLVEIEEDEDGELVTSCVVRADVDAPIARRPKLPRGGNQRIAYDALGPLFRASTCTGKAGAPPTRPCIRLEEALMGVKDHLAVEAKRRPERARLAITGLIAAGILGHNDDWLWLV